MDHPTRSRPLCRKVYVGGLGNNGKPSEIGNAFCQYGPLKRVWVARNPPGFAFVDFVESSDAQNAITALDGTILCGRRVRVAFANKKSRSTSRGQSRNTPTRNSVRESCYACGESGHYVRDCYVHQIAMLALEAELELDSSCFDSDDDIPICTCERLPELCSVHNDFFEFLDDHFEARSSSYNNDQESSNQNSRNSAQQQHRYNRSQEQSRNNQSQHCISNCTPSASSKTNSALDEVQCVICLDTDEGEMEYIPCGHGFHAKCCNEWLSVNDICPICRAKVGSRLDQVGVDQICPMS